MINNTTRKRKNRSTNKITDYFPSLKRLKFTNYLGQRPYPWIYHHVPPELSRYILNFLYPIHCPPTKLFKWTKHFNKKWCKLCGEIRKPSAPACSICHKFMRWTCTGCSTIQISHTCRKRRFPVTESDSEYEGDSDS